MTKCVKIMCTLHVSEELLEIVSMAARKFFIEGALHLIPPDGLKIVACGTKERIESFVDILYKEAAKKKPFVIEVEPFIKDKDYRGVFRIIQ